MQDPKNSHTRKRWYQRAIEAITSWKALSKPILENIIVPRKNISLWKTISKTTELNQMATTSSSRKLRKCTSTRRVASSFSHVCLCAPISSEIFQTDAVAPRKSFSYARSRSLSSSSSSSSTRQEMPRAPAVVNARMSVEGRKIFRGKSLRDDVLMRRFVVEEEEEAMKMKVRRRRNNEMEVIRRRMGSNGMRRKEIGPSPLSRMVLAQEESSN